MKEENRTLRVCLLQSVRLTIVWSLEGSDTGKLAHHKDLFSVCERTLENLCLVAKIATGTHTAFVLLSSSSTNVMATSDFPLF
jgi:hypothetical protein